MLLSLLLSCAAQLHLLGAGYVPQSKWYQLGFTMSVFYLAVWVFAGGAWWKALGYW
jgi:DASS family divalent anion:Na+ symporter